MMTITQLKEYADRKNLKFDTFSNICQNEYFISLKKGDEPQYMMDNDSHKSFAKTYFGLQTSTGVWYWFKKSNRIESESIWFDHRYSQLTGQKVKGFTTGFNLTHKIENFLNK